MGLRVLHAMAEKQARNADSMGDIVSGLEDIAQSDEEISIRAVVAEFGDRSFAPFMLILSLLGMLPTGSIPGVPTVIALCIALVAIQMALGRKHIWLPGFIAERSVSSDKLSGATDKLEWMAEKLDALAQKRLQSLTGAGAVQVVGAIIVILCCMIPFLEVVPFAAAGPFAVIGILSLSLIVRDGLIVLIGGLLSAGSAAAVLVYFVF